MPRLILLNGMPGLGKSMLAQRYAGSDPGTVLLDVDELHRAAGLEGDVSLEDVRTQALVQAASSLAGGRDVVVPQLVARVEQLERFEQVASRSGAGFVHVLLVDAADDPVARFHHRGGPDPWHDDVRAAVAAAGGDGVLERYSAGLDEVRAARPDIRVVRSVEGDPDHTWARFLEALT